MGSSEVQCSVWSHAERPSPVQLLDGHGQHFFSPVDIRARNARPFIALHKSLIETITQVLPIEDIEKAKLLPVKSSLLRLRLVVHWIEHLNSHWFV